MKKREPFVPNLHLQAKLKSAIHLDKPSKKSAMNVKVRFLHAKKTVSADGRVFFFVFVFSGTC